MADQKLTQLTNLASPTTDDLLYVVDDPAGTPASRKATVAAVLGVAVPTGGTAGQVLTKDSGTDFDTSWAAPSAGVAILDNSRPNITVTSTAAETDVYTVTVPGGTLGTTGRVHMELVGAKLKNGGGTDSAMTMKAYYGTTMIAALSVPGVSADSANLNALVLDVFLSANGATNAQVAHSVLQAQRDGGASPSGAAVVTAVMYATAAEDSTADKTFKVTWTQANTNLHAYTSQHGLVTVP